MSSSAPIAANISSASIDVRSLARRAFAGVTPLGIVFIVALCVLNGLRRSVQAMLGPEPVMPMLATFTGQSLTQATLLFVTIVPIVNLVPPQGWRRVAALAAGIIAATSIGSASITLWPLPPGAYTVPTWAMYAGLPRWAVLASLLTGAWLFFRNEQQNAAALHRAELARIGLDRRMTEARLQVLQAQIEPHFLFNTLAHIRLLYQSDPPVATRMLDNLMRYLAVALPRMRELDSTLGRELDLVEAYLTVQQVRMGDRLAFEIEAVDSLRAVPVPPMMLLTLAENAIKHGLSPLPEGGSIRVAATVDDDRLTIEVCDNGRGFDATSSAGTGTGLANVRARLAALYGDEATLSLGPNQPHGMRVRFAVPHRLRASRETTA